MIKWVLLSLVLLIGIGALTAAIIAAVRSGGGAGMSSTDIDALSDAVGEIDALSGAFSTLLESFSATAVPAPVSCDVLIVGAGAGGLTMAYRLTKIYGSRLCVIDDRAQIGGKVRSFSAPNSTPQNPLATPTHAEQFRGGDAILRCMAQELFVPSVARGSVGTYWEGYARGVNFTGRACYGTAPNTGPASCAAGLPSGRVAPNGDLAAYAGPDLCNGQDWRACSYDDAIIETLKNPNNANTIKRGELFSTYSKRIIGVEASQYATDLGGYVYGYTAPADAKGYVEYLKYDSTFPYGAIHMSVGGPIRMWDKVHAALIANGTRVFLNERVTTGDYSTGNTAKTHRFTVTTNLGTKYIAKRVVLAVPAGAARQLGGTAFSRIAASGVVQKTGQTHACTYNAFYPNKWWHPVKSQCMFGYCAIARNWTTDNNATIRTSWMNFLIQAGWGGFVQYVSTPERNASNLVRIFADDHDCDEMDAIYAAGGIDAVTDEIHNRLRDTLTNDVIPDPVSAVYSSEKFAYWLPGSGTDFTATQAISYAKEPIRGEKICLASESYYGLDSGWQEGAAKSAHSCLKGPVFTDVISNGEVARFERCTNAATGRQLDVSNNQQTGNDVCLLLFNERHMRDLAGFNVCGGPTTVPSIGTTVQGEEADDWSNAVTTPVYDDQQPRLHGRLARMF